MAFLYIYCCFLVLHVLHVASLIDWRLFPNHRFHVLFRTRIYLYVITRLKNEETYLSYEKLPTIVFFLSQMRCIQTRNCVYIKKKKVISLSAIHTWSDLYLVGTGPWANRSCGSLRFWVCDFQLFRCLKSILSCMSKLINQFGCCRQNNQDGIALFNCNMTYIWPLGHDPYINLIIYFAVIIYNIIFAIFQENHYGH
jgi:hypothetical protein